MFTGKMVIACQSNRVDTLQSPFGGSEDSPMPQIGSNEIYINIPELFRVQSQLYTVNLNLQILQIPS